MKTKLLISTLTLVLINTVQGQAKEQTKISNTPKEPASISVEDWLGKRLPEAPKKIFSPEIIKEKEAYFKQLIDECSAQLKLLKDGPKVSKEALGERDIKRRFEFHSQVVEKTGNPHFLRFDANRCWDNLYLKKSDDYYDYEKETKERDEIKDFYFVKRLEIEKKYELAYLISIYYQLGINSNEPVSLRVEHYKASGLADFIAKQRALEPTDNKKNYSYFERLFYKKNYDYNLSFQQFLENKMSDLVTQGKI